MKRLLCLVCAVLALGCEQHEPSIVLGPLPPRPKPAQDEDDAGLSIPPGAMPCETAAQCDDAVGCTRDECLKVGYCVHIPEHAKCSDDVYCNGVELCDPVDDCQPALPPRCDDGDACTIDRCDEAQKSCVHAPRDFDHDGEVDDHCPGGTDCDDFDETRGTRVSEVCGNQIDDDCDQTVDEHDCGRADHDKCDDPLDVSAGGTFELELDGSAADYTFSCDASSSRDVVLTFALEHAANVQLQAQGVLEDGSEEIATLLLERSCGDASSDVECRRGFPSDLRARALEAGRYYVIATSYGARSLRVTATFSAATPASPNQSCRAAVDVSEGGRFPGDFIDVADSTSGCGVVGSPDLYYALTLPGTRDVELAAQNDDGAPLALRVQSGGCSALGATRLCDAQLPAQARLHELPKGTYTITVSGPASREVPFTLDVAVLPPTAAPPGDRCQAPLTLALDEKKQITFSDKQDDVATSCQRFGPDAVLALHVPKATDLSFELDAGDPLAVLSLQSACGDPGSELSCRAGQPLQTRVHDVPAGDYFVVVEAPAAASATVKVTKLPISPVVLVTGNENCANAFDVPETGGLFVGDTTNLLDDYSAPCGAGAKSADAVYRLTLTEARHVVATIDAEFDSVLNRMTDDRVGDEACTDTPSDACDDDSGTGSQAVLDEKLDPGTYYYVVDGFKRDNAGRYLFDVTVTDK